MKTNSLDVLQVARELDIHPNTLYPLLRSGALRGTMVGNKWYIEKREVARFAKKRRQKVGLWRSMWPF